MKAIFKQLIILMLFSLSIAAQPTLQQPVDGSTVVTLTPTFAWAPDAGATQFRIQISEDINFTTFVYNQNIGNNTALTLTTPLEAGKTYYWHVRSNIAGTPYSPTWTFYTNPGTPTIATPTLGTQNQPVNITLSWHPGAGAEAYTIDVSEDGTFATTTFSQSGVTDTSITITGLNYNTLYTWRVKSTTVHAESFYSFGTFLTILSDPTLISPANNAVHQPTNITLLWHESIGANAYTVEVSDDPLFATTVFSQTGITDTTVTVSGLTHFTQYYWRVKGIYAYGTSNYSSATFLTKLAPPTLSLPANNSVKNSIIPLFDWNPTIGQAPIVYTLEISKSNTFPAAGLIKIENITNTEFQFAPPAYVLENDKDYYYRVKAIDAYGESDYSTVFKFRTVIQIKAVLSTPTNGSDVNTNPTMFVWYLNQVGTGLLYDFEISLNADMTNPVIKLTDLTETTLEQDLAGLPGNTKLYWRVTSKTSTNVVSAYSNISYFKIQAPGFVTLIPKVSYPIGNTTVYGTSTTLYWYLLGNGQGLKYQLIINTVNDFTGALTATDIEDLYYEANNLTPGETYYWKVRSTNGSDTSNWSSLGKFKVFGTLTPVKPVATYPIDNTIVYLTNPTLYWYVLGNSTGLTYDLQIDKDGTFSTNIIDTTGISDLYFTAMNLTPGVKYYWRVRSNNGTTPSAWTTKEAFRIYGNMASLVPHPYSPATGSTVYSTDTVLRWYMNSASEGLTYEIEINTTNVFTGSPTGTYTGILDQYLELANLTAGTTYYWKVRSNNGITPSAWSAKQTFTVIGVGGSPVPVISWPKGGVHVFTNTQLLLWYINGNSTGLTYDIQISNNGLFGTNPTKSDLTDMQYELTNLLIGDLVYWRVRSNNGVTPSAWSTTEYFVVYSESAAFMPISGTPGEGITINTVTPTLSWAMPVANSNLNYELQYADNPEMNNAVTVGNLNSNNVELTNLSEYTTYYWRVRSQTSGKGDYSIYSNVESFSTGDDITGVEEENTIPTEYYMSQNYPNPFNPTTNIKFGLPNNANVKIVIYNILGQEIKTLINKDLNAGTYNLVWNGTNEAGIKVPSGAYLYRITAGNFVETKKLMLIK